MEIKNFFKTKGKITIYAALVSVLLITLPIVVDAVATNGKIRYGVRIGGISVGLLGEEEARQKIEESLENLQKKPIVITGEKGVWQVTPDEIEAALDLDETIETALAYGRKGGFIAIIKDRFLAWIRPYNVALEPSHDEDRLNAFIYSIEDEVNIEPVNATIILVGSDINISKSSPGIVVDEKRLKAMLIDMLYMSGKREVLLPKIDSKPFVTETELLTVKDDFFRILKDPVTLKFEDQKLTLKGDSLKDVLIFKEFVDEAKGKGGYSIKLGVDEDKFRDILDAKFVYEGEKPKDATFRIDGTKVTVMPGSMGIGIDYLACIGDIERSFRGLPPREIMLEIGKVEPKLTSEEAKKMGIEEIVSKYTTNHPPNNPPRISNIHLLADALDGTIVAPGETFSFNETIGPRTAAKGYKEAPTIVGGKLVPTIGGGVCQVGTTICNTAFFAGYPIVERINHSFYISKYPIGRDATVSYGDKDFKFKNDTEAHVLIKTSYTGTSITVAFFSTDYDTKVSSSTTPRSNPRSYGEDVTEDPNLPAGQRVVEEAGISGFDVTVYRTVMRGGKTILEDKFFSRYRPKHAIVRVGTKGVAPDTSPQQTIDLPEDL